MDHSQENGCPYKTLSAETSQVGKPDAHNTGAESNTKLEREKQGALIVAIYLPTKHS
jgi:hypothetical protein